jgi:dGTPase
MIELTDVPAEIIARLGTRHSRRIDIMVKDLIVASRAEGDISLSEPMSDAISGLRNWLFEHVYQVETVDSDFEKASHVLRELFRYFVANESVLSEHGGARRGEDSIETSVADFIAGMTDRYAMNLFQKLFFPQPWKVL